MGGPGSIVKVEVILFQGLEEGISLTSNWIRFQFCPPYIDFDSNQFHPLMIRVGHNIANVLFVYGTSIIQQIM